MHRDVKNSYVENMIEKTTRNTIDDCTVYLELHGGDCYYLFID